jgi:transaldolase/glucose-6-phosphate isomerase
MIEKTLGPYQVDVEAVLTEIKHNRILPRIWDHDYTVWKNEPKEITNRLGWLRIAEAMKPEISRMQALADQVRLDGYTQALLLGMGGSSLAPEVFRNTFGVKKGYLDLSVLDSTDPEAVLDHDLGIDYAKTLFIVSTKSGGTVETLSFFKYFYNRAVEILGKDQAGDHFIAITDPSLDPEKVRYSKLEKIARDHHFRDIFLNDPNIGGRFSALSFFGLVPAALLGVDLHKLLDSAIQMSTQDELGAQLGAIVGTLAKADPVKRDKATFIFSENIASFGDWVEQLIAESTGKKGVGILPVVDEPLGTPEVYGADRLFVHIRLGDDASDAANAAKLLALEEAGHPVIRIQLDDLYDIGGQFFLWELATVVAGHIFKINPFDQPNVEAAKIIARNKVEEFKKKGFLPTMETALFNRQSLQEFLGQIRPGDYIAIQAYVPPTSENESALQTLRLDLRDRYKLATSLGFGPRFLHSTGQLHKGDSGNGLFIQFTSDPIEDVDIPDETGKPDSAITFGTLISAQALGDGQALLNEDRRFIRFNLGTDIIGNLTKLSRG